MWGCVCVCVGVVRNQHSLLCPASLVTQLCEYTNVEPIFYMFVNYGVFFPSDLGCLRLSRSLHLSLFPLSPSVSPSHSLFLLLSFSSVHWGHCKTLVWVPSPQEAQELRVDWSLDFTTGSQNEDCSRSFSFPLRTLWIKDSWLLLQ